MKCKLNLGKTYYVPVVLIKDNSVTFPQFSTLKVEVTDLKEDVRGNRAEPQIWHIIELQNKATYFRETYEIYNNEFNKFLFSTNKEAIINYINALELIGKAGYVDSWYFKPLRFITLIA